MAAVRELRYLRLIAEMAAATIAATILSCPFSGRASATGEQRAEIAVNEGRYGPYFHLRIDLSAAAIDFAKSDRGARPGGQFELRLRADRFPVPAPSCRGDLILRMPWTAPDVAQAEDKIAAKEVLLARILALEHDRDAAVPVVVELNPYVEVIRRAPLELRLTQCNVFFRHAAGAYVDRTGPLEQSDKKPSPARDR